MLLCSTIFCSIIFAGCSDEDKPAYLSLAVSSCEVVQGCSVEVKVTAHPNTTLETADPEIADASYVWSESGAVIDVTGKRAGRTDIIVTDNETAETATLSVIVGAYPMPHLTVNKQKGNILETMTFSVVLADGPHPQSIYFKEICDSIVWTAEGVDGSYRVFDYETGDGWEQSHFTMQWGHCFAYPAEYKTTLTAWKDNRAIADFRLDVAIGNDKDFLGYDWDEITEESQSWTTYASVLGDIRLMTTSGVNGDVPFVEARMFPTDDFAASLGYLYDYIEEFYSQPDYEDSKDKGEIFRRYDELFSEQKRYPYAYPRAIWTTQRANIALILEESIEEPRYIVYAEPAR